MKVRNRATRRAEQNRVSVPSATAKVLEGLQLYGKGCLRSNFSRYWEVVCEKYGATPLRKSGGGSARKSKVVSTAISEDLLALVGGL